MNIKELEQLFEKEGSITKASQIYCKKHKIPYTDKIRRKVSHKLNKYKKEKPKHSARILLFDIETSPLIVYSWGLWNQNISHTNIIQDWKILCFSAKWLFEDEVMAFSMTKEELKNFDDSRITKQLWKLLDESHVVITQNGIKFDQKKANSKFLEHNLNPPSSYQSIDTLLHSRKQLGEVSNRLDFLSKKYGSNKEGKIESYGLWDRVMKQDYSGLTEMSEYCKNDVLILEDYYLKLRPFIKPHPSLQLFIEEDKSACPSCGSTDLKNENKPYTTTVAQYELYRCNCCGSLSRGRKSNNILSSVPY